jgi:hypothetical protein
LGKERKEGKIMGREGRRERDTRMGLRTNQEEKSSVRLSGSEEN